MVLLISNIKKVFLALVVIIILIGFGTFTMQRAVRNAYSRVKDLREVVNGVSDAIKEFPANFEDSAIRVNMINIALYYSTGMINSNQVMLGKEGWLFYSPENDGNPIDDYLGNNSFSENEMEAAKDNMLSIQESLERENIEFCLLVPPNKEEVYSRYMPIPSIKAQQSRTDKLMDFLSENGVNSVNPKDKLLHFNQNYLTYYKQDTHWNELGAYIGTRSVLKTFGLDLPELSDDRIIKGDHAPSDLSNMVGLKNVFEPDYGYTAADVEKDSTTIDNEIVHFHNENAMFDKTVFIVGDSFRKAMVPTLRTAFQDVYVVHRIAYSADALIAVHPDYVILEFVERYSSQIADFKLL